MKKFYISFGQSHAHAIAGKTFDKDCIAVLEAENSVRAHDKAMEVFKQKFCFVYDHVPDMSYFPRGLIKI